MGTPPWTRLSRCWTGRTLPRPLVGQSSILVWQDPWEAQKDPPGGRRGREAESGLRARVRGQHPSSADLELPSIHKMLWGGGAIRTCWLRLGQHGVAEQAPHAVDEVEEMRQEEAAVLTAKGLAGRNWNCGWGKAPAVFPKGWQRSTGSNWPRVPQRQQREFWSPFQMGLAPPRKSRLPKQDQLPRSSIPQLPGASFPCQCRTAISLVCGVLGAL